MNAESIKYHIIFQLSFSAGAINWFQRLYKTGTIHYYWS
jgi:hypothetical protein